MSDLWTRRHQRLEQAFETLMSQVESLDPFVLRAEWSVFESELLDHLAAEEAEELPAFAREHAAEAQAIRQEHEQIRAALLELGVELDLHELDAVRVRELGELLRRHAQREEGLLYPWIRRREQTLPATPATEVST